MSAWLIDKSALVRLSAAVDAADWASRIERGLVRISTLTRLEVGYSARSAVDHRLLLGERGHRPRHHRHPDGTFGTLTHAELPLCNSPGVLGRQVGDARRLIGGWPLSALWRL